MSSVRLRSDSILRAWLEANVKPRVWYPLNIYIYTRFQKRCNIESTYKIYVHLSFSCQKVSLFDEIRKGLYM